MNLPGTHPVPTPRNNNSTDDPIANEFDKHQKYPLEMLRGDPLNLPTYINPSRKEVTDGKGTFETKLNVTNIFFKRRYISRMMISFPCSKWTFPNFKHYRNGSKSS